jgi:hypothetical protein
MNRRLFHATTSLLLAVTLIPTARGDQIIEVSAEMHDRFHTPLSVELPASLRKHKHFTLKRLDNGFAAPVQVSSREPPRLLWLLREPLKAGHTRRYRLSVAEKSPPPPGVVAVHADEKRLLITVRDKPVLAYNTAVVPAPDRRQAVYDRSGYIHPLYNPRGQVVTDDFAPDHPHQHGIMFPWTNTRYQGRAVNFWDQQNGKGRVEHASATSLQEGPVFGGFHARLKHLDATTPAHPRTALEETWRVRVYNLTDYFLWDIESRQRAVGSPLQIQKYHYGGFAIRGHRHWLTPGQGDFLTSQGKTRKDGNHTRPHWCDIHGLIDGQATGVTIFCHPSNFRAPQFVRLHPEKPYFCFSPMVEEGFRIQTDASYISRYRLYVHNGPLDLQAAQRIWLDLAQPASVRILAAQDRHSESSREDGDDTT